MTEYEIVTVHFAEMAELTRRLATVPALMLGSGYSYSDFGSWWFVFKKDGTSFRISFDGKEKWIRLEECEHDGSGRQLEWREISVTSPSNGSPLSVAELVQAASPQ